MAARPTDVSRGVGRRRAGRARMQGYARPAGGAGALHVVGGGPDGRIAGIQRSRLLAATVAAIDELGYERCSVSHITRRARVSRRTFYELFDGREQCLAAVLDEMVALAEQELAAADLAGLEWRERVRRGLWAILSMLDREPALARVCVVQTLRGGPTILERREKILACLAAVVGEGRGASRGGVRCTPLTAEGVVGAALAIVAGRLARRDPAPLTALLGELTGMIVLPYLGAAAARREQERPAPSPPARGKSGRRVPPVPVADPLQGVTMRLTYRTARILEAADERPGASNRQLGSLAGIQDPGQVSKLLARLQRLGLLENHGLGRAQGEPNEWRLTATGAHLNATIGIHRPSQQADQ